MLEFCMFVFLVKFSAIFIKALVSDMPLIQDNVLSNAGAWLSNATLRFSSLVEQCHTKKNLCICLLAVD